MTTTTPTSVAVEAIFTFDAAIAARDCETGEPVLEHQALSRFSVPVEQGELSEAVVLFSLLSELSAAERQKLIKVSICLALGEEEATAVAPWLTTPDSPLFNGKLWLKQHNLPA